MNSRSASASQKNIEYVIFHVEDIACGMEMGIVQEINKNLEITEVHQAPDFVRGIVNLRGQIVTIIDLRRKLGIESRDLDATMHNIVVKHGDELIGLLVDDVDDVVMAQAGDEASAPPHLEEKLGGFLKGVCKMKDNLVAILDVEKTLSDSNEPGMVN